MRILLLVLGIVSCSFMATAQRLKISEPIDVSRDLEHQIIKEYNDTLLLYRQTRISHVVQAFDTALNVLWEKEVELSEKNAVPFCVVAYDDAFYLLHYYYQKGKTLVWASVYNCHAEKVNDFKLGEFSNRLTLSSKNVLLSQDRTQLSIYSVTFDGNIEMLHVSLQEARSNWEKFFHLEDVNYFKEFVQIVLNNNGDVFLIFEKNNVKRKKEDHYFVIYHLKTNATIAEKHIHFKNRLSYDVFFRYDELNNQLVGAGLYSEDSYMASGLYYLKDNFSDSVIIVTAPFEESFMRSLTGDKRKKIEGVANFDIQDIILRRDGGVILLAEQNLKYEYQVVNLFLQEDVENQQADYLFENVLVASLHPNGEVHWKNVLFKSQDSENDNGRYSSFFLLKTRSSLRLLYNDEIRWDTNVYEYVITGVGTISRNVLQPAVNKNLLLEFKKGIQLSANTFVTTTERNSKLKLVKIIY